MRRLATFIVIGCLLLGGCDRRCVGPQCTALDYRDFLRFGSTYYADDSNLVGRKPRPSDLGPMYAVVRRNPPNDDLNYRMGDGDAAFVAPGAPVYTVKGYRPAFRLAASHGDRLRFYEAREVPGARSGADVLDLAGKVRYIGVNSGFDGTTELAAIKDRKRVAGLVRAVLKAAFRPSQVSEGESCIVAFHLVDRTAVTRSFHLGTGRLDPGVFVPRAFSRSVMAELRAAHKSCGEQP